MRETVANGNEQVQVDPMEKCNVSDTIESSKENGSTLTNDVRKILDECKDVLTWSEDEISKPDEKKIVEVLMAIQNCGLNLAKKLHEMKNI